MCQPGSTKWNNGMQEAGKKLVMVLKCQVVCAVTYHKRRTLHQRCKRETQFMHANTKNTIKFKECVFLVSTW